MKTRREFFKSAAAAGILGAAGLPLPAADNKMNRPAGDDRHYWVSAAEKLARPVLENLARRELKKNMPVEQRPDAGREQDSHLEAFGRLLCGIAPWLALEDFSGDEQKLQREFVKLAQASLDSATDPQSPDFLNFSYGGQPLVDTAFLAQGILRAPKVLWEPLEPRVQKQLSPRWKSSRKIATPDRNNWVMFAAMVEAALLEFGGRRWKNGWKIASAKCSAGMRATAPTATANFFISTITTASSSTRCCWTCSRF